MAHFLSFFKEKDYKRCFLSLFKWHLNMLVNRRFLYELLVRFLKQEAEANGLGDIRFLSLMLDPYEESILIFDNNQDDFDEAARILQTDLEGLLEHLSQNPDIIDLVTEKDDSPSTVSDYERPIGSDHRNISSNISDTDTVILEQEYRFQEYKQGLIDKLIKPEFD